MNISKYTKDLFEALYVKANELYPTTTFPRIPLQFSRKLTKTGGYFQFRGDTSVKIKLSQTIMENNDPKTFIDEVLTHEFAHFIVHEVYGRFVQPHGTEWKKVMRQLGAVPNRCHSFKTTATNGFDYNVNGTIVTMGKVRHNHVQRGTKSYAVRVNGQRVSITASMYVNSTKPEPTPVLPNGFGVVNRPKRTTTRKRKPFNGQSKATVARQLIASWIRMGITKDEALSRQDLVTEMYHKAGMNNNGQAKGYIRDQWSKA